ncbi:MAG: extensin family protein [Kofleriaceae bacterium]|nr:extensin family protein [Kofleriaceae bacterium]
MFRLVRGALATLVACGGGDDGTGGGGDDMVTLAFTSPAPGAELVRDDLSSIGELSAEVAMQVAVEGDVARVAFSLGDMQLGDATAEGAGTAFLAASGPATLTATAFDVDGAPLATTSVDVTIIDPTVADCHAWLDLYSVGYTVGPARMGVSEPVTAMMPINGIAYRVSGSARTTMFADCSLIRALAIAAPIMRSRGIVEVTDLGVYNYRCINNAGTPPNCTIGLSEHSFGNAIDLAAFKASDGTTYTVKTDWVIDAMGEKTCQAPTEPGKDQFLHELACTFKANDVFKIILTPNYNALHRDHFHVDLTDGGNTIKREIDTTDRTTRAVSAHAGLHAH